MKKKLSDILCVVGLVILLVACFALAFFVGCFKWAQYKFYMGW